MRSQGQVNHVTSFQLRTLDGNDYRLVYATGTPLVAHQRAQDTFAHVLVNVTSDQLSSPTPCPEWDVKALIDHVIWGNQRVVERAGGQVAPLPEDLGAAHSAPAKAAQETFAEPEALTRTYQLPIGEVPAALAVRLPVRSALAGAPPGRVSCPRTIPRCRIGRGSGGSRRRADVHDLVLPLTGA